MSNFEFTLILFAIAYFAGVIGALTGLGGGVIIVPALVIFFKIDLRYAIGASLISVIATSSGAALTFMRQHYTNLKIGMFLEVGAILGAMLGAILIHYLPLPIIAIIFGIVLLVSIGLSLRRTKEQVSVQREQILPPSKLRRFLSLSGQFQSEKGLETYQIVRLPLGFGLMTLAGILSGLLGIGSGALKVLSLDLAMGLPYKVATSTSNFMIGMTAAASAGIYFSKGYIDPEMTFPTMLGVLLGAMTGSRILISAKPERLRILFAFIIFVMAIQMIYKGITSI